MQLRWLLSMAVCGQFLVAAPIACVTDTLDHYTAPGFACTAGNLLYDNFNFSILLASSPAIAITAAQITVTPESSGLLFSSPFFQVTGADFETFQVGFRADPPPVDSMEASWLPVRKSTGLGHSQFDVSVLTSNLARLNFSLVYDPTHSVLTNSVGFSPANAVVIDNKITLQANGGAAGFDSVEEVFGAIPEPQPFALCVIGLAFLLALRRRFRSRIELGGR